VLKQQGGHHSARAPDGAGDLAVGERSEGPVFLTFDGQGLDRHGVARVVRRVARRAGITKPVGPHTLRHAFITAALDARVPLRDVQEAASHADPRTTMRSRSCPRQPRLARHLHRRRLPCRSRPVSSQLPTSRLRQARPSGQAEPGNKRPGCVTDRDLDCDHEPPFGALGS